MLDYNYIVLAEINNTPVVVGMCDDTDELFDIISDNECQDREVTVYSKHKMKPLKYRL